MLDLDTTEKQLFYRVSRELKMMRLEMQVAGYPLWKTYSEERLEEGMFPLPHPFAKCGWCASKFVRAYGNEKYCSFEHRRLNRNFEKAKNRGKPVDNKVETDPLTASAGVLTLKG